MDSTTGSAGAHETAIFAGGCFWCVETAFSRLRGVYRVESGYTGGNVPNPTYEQVCSGTTGHAEAVRVEFDPFQISYRDLLEVFFTIHDPTELNRQGNDIGTQYRSAIFYLTPGQKAEAEEMIRELEADGTWKGIVTEVTEASEFWPAETYHHDYYRRNPEQAYCRVVIAPKVAKLRQKHFEKLRADS